MDLDTLTHRYIHWPEIENNFQKNINFSKTKVSQLLPILTESLHDNININESIITFYSLNEVLGKIRTKENGLLDETALKIYEEHHNNIEYLSKRIFSYLLLIGIMEARHCLDYEEFTYSSVFDEFHTNYMYKNFHANALYEKLSEKEYNKKEEAFYRKAYQYAKKEANEEYKYFLEKYANNYIEGKVDNNFLMAHKFISNIEQAEEYNNQDVFSIITELSKEDYQNLTLETLLISLRTIYSLDNFEEGYGGKLWKNIISHALNFAQGKINSEVFIDQALSLEHNNGNIFNKNVIFHSTKNIDIFYDPKDYSEEIISPKKPYYLSNEFSSHELLLNLQHNGILLSFLSIDWTKISQFLNIFSNEYNINNENIEKNKLNIIQKLKDINILKDEYDNNFCIETLSKAHIIAHAFSNHFSKTTKQANYLQEYLKLHNIRLPLFDFYAFTYDKSKSPLYEIMSFLGNSHHNLNHIFNFTQNTTQVKPLQESSIYELDSFPNHLLDKKIIGNKAFGLVEMKKLNLPIPDALILDTQNAINYSINPKEWRKEFKKNLNYIDKKFKNKIISVRSGAPVSMPGMMDTILNVGIDESNYDYFCIKLGKDITDICVKKFISSFTKSMFGKSIETEGTIEDSLAKFKKLLLKENMSLSLKERYGLFPLKRDKQIQLCIESIFKSWNCERAKTYRNYYNIDNNLGTGVILQEMVFGNLNYKSGTGVVFSRDCISGKDGMIGEFLMYCQGEDLVSGEITPHKINYLNNYLPDIYDELAKICATLEEYTGEIQDIEFTIENGQLYILQKRNAVCTPESKAILSQELYQKGKMSLEEFIYSMDVNNLLPTNDLEVNGVEPINKGIIANKGIIRGIVIHKEQDIETYKDLYNQYKNEKDFGWIFYSQQTSPQHANIMLKSDAFITLKGGFTCHAAILARSWNKPCIVGIEKEHDALITPGNIVSVDANSGHIYKGLLPIKIKKDKEYKKLSKLILNYFNIKNKENILNYIQQNNSFFLSMTKKLKHTESWRQCLNYHIVKSERKFSHDKFLDIHNKAAILLLKNRKNRKSKITPDI